MANTKKKYYSNNKNNKKFDKKNQAPRVTARIDQINNDAENNLAAFASVNIGGMVAIHGLRVFESEKGRFVSMPSRGYTDRNGETQYAEIAHPITSEGRTAINNAVLNAYDQALSNTESMTENTEENFEEVDMDDEDLPFEQQM